MAEAPAYTGLRDGYVLLPFPPEKQLNPKDIDWRIEALLGRGNFGQVVRGTWRGKPSALKIANPNNGQEAIDLLMEEATMMMRMHHPNIVTVHGCATKYDHFVMVMEMLNQSLEDLLDKVKEQKEIKTKLEEGTMKEEDLLKRRKSVLNIGVVPIFHILRDVARGLQYLHKQKLIHRDVKPSNILLTREYRAKLCDFGLVREMDLNAKMTNAGSAAYQAPEVVYGSGSYTTSVDIFSFGRVIEKDILPVISSQPLIDLANWILKPQAGHEAPVYGDPKTRPTATALVKRLDTLIKRHESWWKPLPAGLGAKKSASSSLVPSRSQTPRLNYNEDAPTPRVTFVDQDGTINGKGELKPRLSIILSAAAADLWLPRSKSAPMNLTAGSNPNQVTAAKTNAKKATKKSIVVTTVGPKAKRTRSKTAIELDGILQPGENEANRLATALVVPKPTSGFKPGILRIPSSAILDHQSLINPPDLLETSNLPPKRRRERVHTARSRSGSTTVAESASSSHDSSSSNTSENRMDADDAQAPEVRLPSDLVPPPHSKYPSGYQFAPLEGGKIYISPGGRGKFYHAIENHKGATRAYSFAKAVHIGLLPCSCAVGLEPPDPLRQVPYSPLRRPRTRSTLALARASPLHSPLRYAPRHKSATHINSTVVANGTSEGLKNAAMDVSAPKSSKGRKRKVTVKKPRVSENAMDVDETPAEPQEEEESDEVEVCSASEADSSVADEDQDADGDGEEEEYEEDAEAEEEGEYDEEEEEGEFDADDEQQEEGEEYEEYDDEEGSAEDDEQEEEEGGEEWESGAEYENEENDESAEQEEFEESEEAGEDGYDDEQYEEEEEENNNPDDDEEDEEYQTEMDSLEEEEQELSTLEIDQPDDYEPVRTRSAKRARSVPSSIGLRRR